MRPTGSKLVLNRGILRSGGRGRDSRLVGHLWIRLKGTSANGALPQSIGYIIHALDEAFEDAGSMKADA